MSTPQIMLTVRPNVVFQDKRDGTGYELGVGYADNHAHLAIGGVSFAFDGRNDFRPINPEVEYSGIVLQVSELTDDPVRHNGSSVRDGDSPAEKLFFALAAELGYSLESLDKIEPFDKSD